MLVPALKFKMEPYLLVLVEKGGTDTSSRSAERTAKPIKFVFF